MIGRLEKLVSSVSGFFNWIAGAAAVAMLLVSSVDLIGANVFRPLPGAIEITSLLGLLIISFALPLTQVLEGHTAVDFFVSRLRRRARNVIAPIVSFFGCILFAMVTWQMIEHGFYMLNSGEVTAIERIPLWPFAFTTAICTLLMCLVLIATIMREIKGVLK